MSRIVSAARPYLRSLLQGEWLHLSEEVAHPLAAWICLTCMVYEYADPRTLCVSQADRDQLRTLGQPPRNWFMWVALNQKSECIIYHRAFGQVDPLGRLVMGRGDTQFTLFTVGRLVCLALSSDQPALNLEGFSFPYEGKMARSWPLPAQALPARSMDASDTAVVAIVEAMTEALNVSLQTG